MSIERAASIRVRFRLSTTPFCCGDRGDEIVIPYPESGFGISSHVITKRYILLPLILFLFPWCSARDPLRFNEFCVEPRTSRGPRFWPGGVSGLHTRGGSRRAQEIRLPQGSDSNYIEEYKFCLNYLAADNTNIDGVIRMP
ncbi:hypothetical protein Tco_1448750 [Tanacetum coccineum]